MSSIFLDALAKTRLYPLTDRRLSGISHAEQVARLSEGGATLVQLREKNLSTVEFYREAEAALKVARERRIKIVINDRVDIALALHADGVHLGQDDLSPEMARHLLGPEAIIGFSTHNLEQAQLAAKMCVDYVAVGPVFASSTKQASDSPIGLRKLHLFREALGEIPLVAIGGITVHNSRDVVAAGADAVAVISEIWRAGAGAASRTKRLLARLKSPIS